MMKVLQMDPSYAERDLNVGFSGGEKKKTEILQMLMLNPEFVILDETDSGLDVDAVRTVSKGIEAYRKQSKGSLLVITHSTKILRLCRGLYTHHGKRKDRQNFGQLADRRSQREWFRSLRKR